MVRYALFSVSDKNGIVEIARKILETHSILASGGTASYLEKSGIEITRVSNYTGFPEILEGRVKTLHPAIHGGILNKNREEQNPDSILPIDLVVCNFYDFHTGVEMGLSHDELVELIDIGGPTLVRAAAKNSEFVTVITDPNDYSKVVRLWPEVPDDLKIDLATKAFDYVSQYDRHISSYFQNLTASPKFTVEMRLQSKLRYGENSHQTAEYYVDKEPFYNQISGPDLSYNNLLDIGSGLDLLSEFEDPSCVIIKHRTPCGVASAQELKDAYLNALATDSLSAYGGVFLLNREVNLNTAKELATMFVDVLIAPGYASGVLEIFSSKSKLKILTYDDIVLNTRLISQVPGGIVVQDRDMTPLTDDLMEVRSQKKPDIQTLSELKFAWKIVKHAKSNAIVVCKASRALGIGSGQTSRVEAAESAIRKSGADAKGAVLASDAFFPFADSIELAAEAGIRAVIAPKGSIRDQEVVDAANRLGLILVFTSVRAFKH